MTEPGKQSRQVRFKFHPVLIRLERSFYPRGFFIVRLQGFWIRSRGKRMFAYEAALREER